MSHLPEADTRSFWLGGLERPKQRVGQNIRGNPRTVVRDFYDCLSLIVIPGSVYPHHSPVTAVPISQKPGGPSEDAALP